MTGRVNGYDARQPAGAVDVVVIGTEWRRLSVWDRKLELRAGVVVSVTDVSTAARLRPSLGDQMLVASGDLDLPGDFNRGLQILPQKCALGWCQHPRHEGDIVLRFR